MDLKTYERTRYQNIYRHKKNKNYVIMMSKPVKTSISRIDGKKIMRVEDALDIRDNKKLKIIKGNETLHKDDFDVLWNKYMEICKSEKHLAYNTIIRKEKTYNKYLKDKIKMKVTKISKDYIANFIQKQSCSDKTKNQILKELKSFFNWCLEEDYLIYSPVKKIKKLKIEKVEMKYWTPEELKKFINTIDKDIEDHTNEKKARLIKVFTLIEFSLGDRVGETRALTFNCFDSIKNTVSIKHSINYDRKSSDFLSNTKNYQSQRVVDITDKLINEVASYQKYLIENTKYNIKDNNLIFFNYSTNKPYNDATLRKHFKYYCHRANVTEIRMYDLRHTYVATMMLEGKELYHISSRIGHSNYSTTVNKYGHLSQKARKEVAEITDKYI